MQIFAGVNTRCIVFLNVLLDVTASKCVIGFTQRCSVLNNVVGEPRNYTALRLCALRAIRGHKAGRNLLTRNCMGKPEVRGLQSRWTGTEIIAAATVYNFSDRIRATTASRLNGSPQQHLVVELLEDHSGYVPLHFREKETRATPTVVTKNRYWGGVEWNRYRYVWRPSTTRVEKDFAALFCVVRWMWKQCMGLVLRNKMHWQPEWKWGRPWRLAVVAWFHKKTFVRTELCSKFFLAGFLVQGEFIFLWLRTMLLSHSRTRKESEYSTTINDWPQAWIRLPFTASRRT